MFNFRKSYPETQVLSSAPIYFSEVCIPQLQILYSPIVSKKCPNPHLVGLEDKRFHYTTGLATCKWNEIDKSRLFTVFDLNLGSSKHVIYF